MERVRVAAFADPLVASLSADFLQRQGFDADVLEVSGKGPSLSFVLVARHQAGAAWDRLRSVARGGFEAGTPDLDPELAEVAIELSRAIRGTAMAPATPDWLNCLPIPVIAAGLVLLVILRMLSPAVHEWMAIQMGW